jgi:hypothetical protein
MLSRTASLSFFRRRQKRKFLDRLFSPLGILMLLLLLLLLLLFFLLQLQLFFLLLLQLYLLLLLLFLNAGLFAGRGRVNGFFPGDKMADVAEGGDGGQVALVGDLLSVEGFPLVPVQFPVWRKAVL